MILSIGEAADYKRVAAEKFNAEAHFHDGCGGQYFTLDAPNGQLKQFTVNYFAERGIRAVFSQDGLRFYTEKE